jgi:hypothetical protein
MAKAFKFKGDWYEFHCDPNTGCDDCDLFPEQSSLSCHEVEKAANVQGVRPCDDGKYHRGVYKRIDPLYEDFKQALNTENNDPNNLKEVKHGEDCK